MGKTRKGKGGAYVARGSYGCTFRKPPLKCKDEAARRNNRFISKLITKQYADKELRQSDIFRKIDPEENYFVTIEKACDVNTENIKPENQIEKCPFTPSNSQLFLMRDAGSSLDRLGLSAEQMLPFVKSFTNLFEGLKLAHSKDIVHHDIKPANVVTMPREDGTGFLTRFIDFGIGMDLSNAPTLEEVNSALRIANQLYAYYPFEQIIMYPLTLSKYDKYTDEKKKEVQEYVKRMYVGNLQLFMKYFPFLKPLFLTNANRPLFGLKTIVEEVFVKNDTFTSYHRAFLYYFKACDVYMFGLTLASIIQRLGIHVIQDDMGNVDFVLLSTYKKNNTRMVGQKSARKNIPGFTEWFDQLKSLFLKPLFELIVAMTLPVAEDRLTIVQADEQFINTVLKNVDTVLTPGKLKMYLSGN
jgi:serine/threonine protein kinase